MPAHSHPGEATASYNWGRSTSLSPVGYSFEYDSTNANNYVLNTGVVGGNQAHNNMPPFTVINWIMKL